mgnify:CR=1 FL=1
MIGCRKAESQIGYGIMDSMRKVKARNGALFTPRGMLIGTVILGLIVLGLTIVRPDNFSRASLPESLVKDAAFTPYFYKGNPPDGFMVDSRATSYNSGMLFIRLVKDQRSVVITQQMVPANLRDSKVQGTENIEGVQGSAALTFKEGRTTGTLITNDKTMIIVTSADDVESSSIKDFVRLLRPLR